MINPKLEKAMEIREEVPVAFLRDRAQEGRCRPQDESVPGRLLGFVRLQLHAPRGRRGDR